MTIEEAKTFLDNLKVCIEEHPIVADWLVEIADRKTEPQREDCGACEHSRITCRYMECGEPCHYQPKGEPQTEKPNIWKRIDKPFRAVWLDDDHNEIGTPQTEREGE